jgi:hypothetical protein
MKIRQITPECPEGGSLVEIVEPDGSRRLSTARPLREGEDLRGSHLVEIDNRTADGEGYRVARTVYDGRTGPAQVATPSYREGWDRVFSKEEIN